MGVRSAMKLDEFVMQTLVDISNGVEQAKREALVHIAPASIDGETLYQPQIVRFEVAVTVNAEAGGGIKVFSLGDLKAQGSSAHTNKITFDVPVYLNLATQLNPLHHEVDVDNRGDKETKE